MTATRTSKDSNDRAKRKGFVKTQKDRIEKACQDLANEYGTFTRNQVRKLIESRGLIMESGKVSARINKLIEEGKLEKIYVNGEPLRAQCPISGIACELLQLSSGQARLFH